MTKDLYSCALKSWIRFYLALSLLLCIPLGLLANCTAPSLGSNPGEHCTSAAGTIAGWVWEDWNSDGLINVNEKTGIPGVEVRLIDASGITLTTCTDPEGNFEFTGVTELSYRLEFHPGTDVTAWASPSRSGADNGTSVQFKSPGECANYGMAAPDSYCQSDPMLYTTCFVVGPYDAAASSTQDFRDSAAIVKFPYSRFGDQGDIWYQMPSKIAKHRDVGTTYGTAVNYKNGDVYVSAFMRRGAGFGPLGPGGIYKIDAAGTVTNFATIPNAGIDPHDFVGDHKTATYDLAAAISVGKISLGDLEISPDKSTLYVTNLNDGHLYSISADVSATVTDLGLIDAAVNCDVADSHPFGLGFDRNGNLYVGTVCGNETSGNATVSGTVHKYAGGSFSLEHNMNLYFQDVYAVNDPYFNGWDDGMSISGGYSRVNVRFQPMMADIGFIGADQMILGFRTRDGDMAYATFGNVLTGGGTVINFCKSMGSWVMESNAVVSCPNAVTGAHPNQFGPDGGYFYDIDDGISGFAPAGMGSFAFNETTKLVATILDPTEAISAGTRVINYTDGSEDYSYEVYYGSPDGNGSLGLFGKLNGLGDIENECKEAPMEIGNLVWVDIDGDGIQDPDEPGIPGVNVLLYNDLCEVVAELTTDANGQYYFSDEEIEAYVSQTDTELIPDATYYIVLGTGGQYAGGTLTANNTTYTLSLANTGAAPNLDINDSDGIEGTFPDPPCVDGLPFATVTTGLTGNVDESFDFGFDNPLSLPLDLIYFKATEKNCLVELTWQTKNEEDIDFFSIEKSFDGIYFDPITNIKATGGINETLNYKYTDSSPKLKSYNYYRLIAVDIYGYKEIYSMLVPVKVECSYGNAVLYPNPSNSSIFMEYTSDHEDELQVEIVDMLGRTIFTQNHEQVIGKNQLIIDVKSLSNAEYFIRTKGSIRGIGMIKRFTKIK